jgi:excisionase family DNA binding protein
MNGVERTSRPVDERTRAEATRLLKALRRTKNPRLALPSGERAELPDPAANVLLEALAAVADGRDVKLVAADRDLTTGQAADLLGISRQYLVRLLDNGVIASYLVGTHRRIRLDDLLQFKSRRDEQRRAALREMVCEAEAAGLYP